MYGSYYQAHGARNKIWFIMGCVRNEDNWAFGRTYDRENNILEFFVAPGNEANFVNLMTYLKDEGYLFSFEKKPNRLEQGESL